MSRPPVEAGADAVGFVLTESPRRVTPELVRELLAGVPEGVLSVAVFREEPAAYVREMVRASGGRGGAAAREPSARRLRGVGRPRGCR
ncbi:hypothetical protein GCM10020229_36120 [Kitasatospora albolonga]|uniref:hypothetical protein n=1 Tax=Kitasatospora albolonga TaxID=68173 RepID=UPI0031E7D25A